MTLARAGSSYATASGLVFAVAALALLLACVGMFGAVAFATARRRAEIAVRLALGAPRPRAVAQCLASVGRPCAAGAAAGVGLSLLVVLVLRRVAAVGDVVDVWWVLGPVAVVVAAATVAAVVPAVRAVRASVWTALRSE